MLWHPNNNLKLLKCILVNNMIWLHISDTSSSKTFKSHHDQTTSNVSDLRQRRMNKETCIAVLHYFIYHSVNYVAIYTAVSCDGFPQNVMS